MKKKILLLTALATLGLKTGTIAQTVPSYVPTNGLVAWYPFNGNANDESGNGNDGVVNGAILTSDRFGNVGKAYDFNGTSSYISNIISQNDLDSFTVSIWYYSPTPSNSVACLYNIWDATIETNQAHLNLTNTPSTFLYSWINGIGQIDDEFGTRDISNWHQVIIVKASDSQFTFVDGVANFGSLSGTNISFNFNKFELGRELTSGGLLPQTYWIGKLDDVGFWNRALTQQEISDLYNSCELSVNTQPTNQTININNTTQFVVGSSDPSANFQWQTDLGVGFQNLNNVGQYSGTATNTLNVSNVTISNNNQPFRCIVTSGSCSDTSNVAVLTVNNNVGLNETSQDKLFSVFPNPAQSVINVKADSKLIGSVYSIYDNTGRVVLTGKLNSQNTTIELGNLSSGIYMFSVGENMKQTFKVIKE